VSVLSQPWKEGRFSMTLRAALARRDPRPAGGGTIV
jgi:hypothetical protein